jgi:hypothetical protein
MLIAPSGGTCPRTTDRNMLLGLRSRWTICLLWMYSMPSRMARVMRAVVDV